ncbi:uncharacterized protein [Dermacentor andersoni]|uniref:uncharacterized protein isoform X2 n=1 Tax=Dermacentor andersoni TaxID=34620 RepID=UPI003B3AB73B
MAALVLASSLLSAVTTFCNRRSIENALLSWVNNPAVQRWMGSWATETVSTLVKKGQVASPEKESGPTWTQTILLALSALMVGVWIGWYLRGPQTRTNAAPSQPQPQQIVLPNIIQVDRRMREIRGRRSSSQPPRQGKKDRRSGRRRRRRRAASTRTRGANKENKAKINQSGNPTQLQRTNQNAELRRSPILERHTVDQKRE